MYNHKQQPPCMCRPTPPPPPVPCYHDSYGHDCYHEHKGFPHPHLPVNGPYIGSAFVLTNYNPFLFDSYYLKYGTVINFSENVQTRITQRPDASCINLAAKFNFVDAINKNVVLEEYLEKCIGQNASEYTNGIPLIKSKLTFRMYYSIFDDMGGVVDERALDVSTFDIALHYTDIRDFFLQSIKGVFVDNIPAYDYGGLYRLVINRIELWVDTIDTPSHCPDGYNPYYQWTNNNQTIVLQHDTIEACPNDDTLLLATCDVNVTFPFQANITTRLRLSFTAFTSNLICVNQTYGIWNAIYEPSESRIKTLEDKVTTLEETVGLLQQQLELMNAKFDAINATLNEHQTEITANATSITNLQNIFNANLTVINERLTSLEARVTALENVPLAIHKYRPNETYVRSQLTWTEIGQLYQVKNEFTTGDEAITVHINNGDIIPLVIDGDVTLESVLQRLAHVEDEVSAMDTKVDTAVETVSGYDTIIADVQSTTQSCVDRVDAVETTVQTFDERISKAEEAEFYINRAAFPAVGQIDKMYIDLSEGETYIWNSDTNDYHIIDRQLDDNSTIHTHI